MKDNPSLTQEHGYIVQRHNPETGLMQYATEVEWLPPTMYCRDRKRYYVVTEWTNDPTKPKFFTNNTNLLVPVKRGIQIRCIKTVRKVELEG